MRTVRDRAIRLTTLLTLALAAGCATASGGGGGGGGAASGGAPAAEQSGTASSRDVLTAEQLRQSAGANLYDAIKELRPELLSGHHLGTPDVYVDNVRQSTGMDRVKRIAVASVVEVRYVPPSAARLLPGEVSDAGALVVTLK